MRVELVTPTPASQLTRMHAVNVHDDDHSGAVAEVVGI
jgi:hypothetical protein